MLVLLLFLLATLAFLPAATMGWIPSSGKDGAAGRFTTTESGLTNYPEIKDLSSETNDTGVIMEFWVFYKGGGKHPLAYRRISDKEFNETTMVNVLVYRNATRDPANLVVNVTLRDYHLEEDFGPFEPGRYLFVARNNISTVERTYHLVFNVRVRVLMYFNMSIAGFFLESRNKGGWIPSIAVDFYGLLVHDEKMMDVQATGFSLEFHTSEERVPETLWNEVNVSEYGLYMAIPRGMNHLVVKRGTEKQAVEFNTSEHIAVVFYFSPENDSLLDVRFYPPEKENDTIPGNKTFPFKFIGVYYEIAERRTDNTYDFYIPYPDEKGTVIDITFYRVINGTPLKEHPFRKFNLTWFDEYKALTWMIKGEYLVEATLNDTLRASSIVNITDEWHYLVVARDENATCLKILMGKYYYDSPPNPWWLSGEGLLAVVMGMLAVLVFRRRLIKKPN